MRLLRHLNELGRAKRPICLATGVFDGVHLGHRAVIREAVQRARKSDGEALLLTFHPHPAKILQPDQAPSLLTTEQQDYELFSALDVDLCVILDFTREFSRQPAEDFLNQLDQTVPSLKAVVVGPDWHFGHHRQGDFKMLQAWGKKKSIETVEMPEIQFDGKVISSTLVRKLVAAGEISAANARLGRSYQLIGRVGKGDQQGALLGFPTANLEVENELLPANGVYAVRALVEGEVFAAAVNIGARPTVSRGGKRAVEAFLLQFTGNLYGHHLRLDFLARLRDERKFQDVQHLVAQIEQDALAAFHLAHK